MIFGKRRAIFDFRLLSTLFLSLVFTGVSRAQFSGTITGDVDDPNDSVVPSAKLTLTKTDTLVLRIKRSARTTSLKLIPYYAWANREPSSMQIWIPYIES